MKAFSKTWNWFYGKFEFLCLKSFDLVKKIPGTVAFFMIIACITAFVMLIPHLHVDFLPANDQSKLSVSLEFPANISLEGTQKEVEKIIEVIKAHKEVDAVGTTIGYVNGMPGKVNQGVNIAEMTIHLIDKSKRMIHKEFANLLREDLDKFNDFVYAINIPNPVGMSGVEVSSYISGPDSEVIRTHINRAVKLLEEKGIAKEIDTTIRNPKPRTALIPDRAILKNMGFNEMALGTSVLGLFDGMKIGTFKNDGRNFDIRVKTIDIKNIEEAKNNVIGSYKGSPINLDAVVTAVSEPVSMAIARNDRQRSEFIYCNCAAGATAGDIMSVLRNDVASQLPNGYTLKFGPPVDSMDEAMEDFAEVFISAIVLLYLLMAAIMESWTKPFLIMFTLPLGFIGMFAASVFTGVPISMISLLGGVMMIGIVVNNAILIMDEVTLLTNQGKKPHDAMSEALKLKLRPIVMTTIASIAGMLPMVLGTGIGSEFRQGCGVGVVGGLLLSAILTVYLIPALYYRFTKNE